MRFDSLVLYDLEFTSWEGFLASRWTLPGKHREIVQIGAVRLSLGPDLAEEESFLALVKPTLHPRLSDYFVDLTGITQDDVDRDGVPFADALAAFAAFVGTGTPQLACHGTDAQVIAENCGWHALAVPAAIPATVNIHPLMCRLHGGEAMSGELPARFGLAGDEPAHDALGDARSLALVVRHLAGQGRLSVPFG